MRTCEVAASLSSLFSGTLDPCHDEKRRLRWRMGDGTWGHGGVAEDQLTAEVGLGGAKLDRGGWQARPWCGLGCLGTGELKSWTRVSMVGSHTC